MRNPLLFAATAALLLAGPAPASRAAEPLPAKQALAAQSKLSFRLIERLEQTREPGRNIVISTASLAAALALIDIGADAKLRAALHEILGFERRGESEVAVDLEAMRTTVSKLGKGLDSKEATYALANAVLIDPSAKPIDAGLERLRATGAEVTVDSLSKPDTLKRINDWVSERTKGLIPTILDKPLDRPGLVALNALYFKALWLDAFDKKRTRPMPFHGIGTADVQVPMMSDSWLALSFRQDARFMAVDLSYRNERFSLVVATSKDRPARAGEFAGIADWLGGEGFTPTPVHLSLPRFMLTEGGELLPTLDAMGLLAGRTSPTALAGLASNLDSIASVMQKTYLSVDEEGTEAAAATAVIVPLRAIPRPPQYQTMVVDKPFVFALRDRDTGLILISGYVGRPGPAATAAR